MPEQSKFENMDLFASLEAIMKQNTGFYQSDLDIDKEIIAKAAASPHREDKTLLWFCRPSGTHCFRERDVFLKDTAPHNTWRFYMEQTSDRVLAYAIGYRKPGDILTEPQTRSLGSLNALKPYPTTRTRCNRSYRKNGAAGSSFRRGISRRILPLCGTG